MGVNKGSYLRRARLVFSAIKEHYKSHALLAGLSRRLLVGMETFNQLLSEYPELMYGGVGATAFVAGGALIYRIATR